MVVEFMPKITPAISGHQRAIRHGKYNGGERRRFVGEGVDWGMSRGGAVGWHS